MNRYIDYYYYHALIVTMESSLSVYSTTFTHLLNTFGTTFHCIHRVIVTMKHMKHIEPLTHLQENTRLHSLRCHVARGIVVFEFYRSEPILSFFHFFTFQYIQSVYYGIFWIYISLNCGLIKTWLKEIWVYDIYIYMYIYPYIYVYILPIACTWLKVFN